MSKRTKQRTLEALRIGVCGLALWLVVRGVTLDDRVVLAEGHKTLVGAVTVRDHAVIIASAGGGTEALPLAEVAVDEDGAPRITYGLASSWQRSRKDLLLAAVLIFSFVPILAAYRVRTLLRVSDIEISAWDALKLTFAGNFLNFAAPLGSTAGDVFKAYYLSQYTRHKTEAMTTVFIDRIIGLGSLIVVVSLITILSPTGSRLAPLRFYMLVLLSAGAVGSIAYLSRSLRRWTLWKRVAGRLPMSDHIRRVDQTALRLAHRTRGLAGAIGITLVLQVLAAAAFFMVAVALGLSAGAGNALEFYAYFSTGEVIKALPGPPQGLGTMELAYGYFFAPFGSASQILCAAFGIRLVMLVCSIPGLLVTLTGSYKPASETRYEAIVTASLQPD